MEGLKGGFGKTSRNKARTSKDDDPQMVINREKKPTVTISDYFVFYVSRSGTLCKNINMQRKTQSAVFISDIYSNTPQICEATAGQHTLHQIHSSEQSISQNRCLWDSEIDDMMQLKEVSSWLIFFQFWNEMYCIRLSWKCVWDKKLSKYSKKYQVLLLLFWKGGFVRRHLTLGLSCN